MRIAYIIPSLVANGPCIVAHDLVEVMTQHGNDCEVFYFDEKGTLHFPCPVHHISMNDKIDLESFDVVHSHEFRPNLYVLFHKVAGPKYVCTLHNYLFRDYRSTYGWIKGKVWACLFLLSIARHDCCVALSKDMMRYYEHFLHKEKLTYAYNTRMIDDTCGGVEDSDIYKRIVDFKGENGKLLGTNCRILKRKNLNLVFKAMTLLPNNYRFVIVGDGPDKELVKRQAVEAGVSDRVLFAGRCEDAYKLLPLYDVFVIPSETEGFPLSLLEAAYFERKCVCSDLEIFKECFTEDEVKIFRLYDFRELALKIKEISVDANIGKRLRKKYDEAYSMDCFYKRYMEIYQQK